MTPEDWIAQRELKAALTSALASLEPIERAVLVDRHGIADELGTKARYQQSAERYGVTIAGAQKIERRALEKLRRPSVVSPIIAAGFLPPKEFKPTPIVRGRNGRRAALSVSVAVR